MKKIFLFTIFVLIFTQISASVITKKFPRKYHVIYTVKVTNNTFSISKVADYTMILGVPVPISNRYQTVSNITTTRGTLSTFLNKNERYIRIAEHNQIPDRVTVEYDITLYDIAVDFDKIKHIYPYDKNSKIYKENIEIEGSYINPHFSTIQKMADETWYNSTDILDYARKAYRRVQKRLKWTTQGNYRGLENIFKNGGGDCNALSSVLISLLRNKGIPARNVTGWMVENQKRQSNHVWVEFYLEGYGWIPADPSVFSSTANAYFGYVDGERIILHRGLNFDYEVPGRITTIMAYQKYFYWHWYKHGSISGDFDFTQQINLNLLSAPNYSSYYNSYDYIENTVQRLYVLINQHRINNGLSALKFSNILSEAAQEIIESQYSNYQIEAKAALSNVGYFASYWFSRWYRFTGNIPEPEQKVYNSQKKYLLNNNVSQVGIGFYYEGKNNRHNYYIIFAKPSN